MLHTYATHLTDILYQHCRLDSEKRPIFQYGFELIISTLCAVFSILLISILFGDIYSALAFLGVFYFLRLCAGGYHAPTYNRCFILTNTVYLLVFFISRIIITYGLTELAIMMTFLSGIVVFCLAPIRNKKHPLSETTYKKNKIISRVLVTAETLSFIVVTLFNLNVVYLAVPMVSLAAVAVMMIIPKLQERSV